MSIRPNSKGRFPKVGNGIHDLALGNGTRFDVVTFHQPDGPIAFGVVGKGCYLFDSRPNPGYLAEKFNRLLLAGDAANLADFIGDQLDDDQEPYGNYNRKLCSDAPQKR